MKKLLLLLVSLLFLVGCNKDDSCNVNYKIKNLEERMGALEEEWTPNGYISFKDWLRTTFVSQEDFDKFKNDTFNVIEDKQVVVDCQNKDGLYDENSTKKYTENMDLTYCREPYIQTTTRYKLK